MEWIFKGNKAFDGWEKVWAIVICLAIYGIVALYRAGTFDRIIAGISAFLKKIDHSIDHSVKRPDTKDTNNQ